MPAAGGFPAVAVDRDRDRATREGYPPAVNSPVHRRPTAFPPAKAGGGMQNRGQFIEISRKFAPARADADFCTGRELFSWARAGVSSAPARFGMMGSVCKLNAGEINPFRQKMRFPSKIALSFVKMASSIHAYSDHSSSASPSRSGQIAGSASFRGRYSRSSRRGGHVFLARHH